MKNDSTGLYLFYFLGNYVVATTIGMYRRTCRFLVNFYVLQRMTTTTVFVESAIDVNI